MVGQLQSESVLKKNAIWIGTLPVVGQYPPDCQAQKSRFPLIEKVDTGKGQWSGTTGAKEQDRERVTVIE